MTIGTCLIRFISIMKHYIYFQIVFLVKLYRYRHLPVLPIPKTCPQVMANKDASSDTKLAVDSDMFSNSPYMNYNITISSTN